MGGIIRQNLPVTPGIFDGGKCRHVDGTPKPDGAETDQAAYFTPEEMDRFFGPFEPWRDWLVRRVLDGKYQVIPLMEDNPYQPRVAFL